MLAVVLALAVVFCLASLGVGFISGSGDYWQTPIGDVADAQIGWFYYARDVWRFPLFFVGNYHQPEGSYVTLSDSLPLLALVFKAIYKLAYAPDGLPPIYGGLWCAACLFLQVLAASRLLLSLGVTRPLQHCMALVAFCYVPWLFFRFGQFGLLAHFFILESLNSYVRQTRTPALPVSWPATCALPVLALLLHPYIAAMCLLLLFATLAESFRRKQLSGARALARLGLTAAGAIVLMFLGGGYFSAAAHNFGDYGIYSLNLLSPFVPLPDTSLGRALNTSIPTIPGLYQWEGACYLGAGVLFLCFVAAAPALREGRDQLKRHAVLAILLLGSLVFAVSNRIGLGPFELAHVPLPEQLIAILSAFRGSGRFVWVAAYSLTAVVILTVLRHYSSRTATLLLAAAALLQFADVVPMQAAIHAVTSEAAKSTIDRQAWSDLIAKHTNVFEFPSFECGGLYDSDTPGGRWRALEIDWLVAKAGKPNNSAYLTRYTKDCDREKESVLSTRKPGTLRLYRSTEDIGALLSKFRVISDKCGYLDDVVVCSTDLDLSSFR